MIQPAYLKKGDKIAIVCPAKKLPKKIDSAIEILEQWGLNVVLGNSVYAEHHQFAGDDDLRAKDLQHFLDNESVKAIIAGRGGYGCIRIIDDLDFTEFKKQPKWLIGFSDITVFLSHLIAQLNTQCMHAQMPYTFDEATPESLESLRQALFGESLNYNYISDFKNKVGKADGALIGGNLSLLTMVQGSASEMDYTDKILFLEEIGEHEYAIDRMVRMLKRSGKLEKLNGLIIGAFNGIETESIPFGQTPEELIAALVKEYDYPVCYNFPTGHINNNLTMILGKNISLNIKEHQVNLNYL